MENDKRLTPRDIALARGGIALVMTTALALGARNHADYLVVGLVAGGGTLWALKALWRRTDE